MSPTTAPPVAHRSPDPGLSPPSASDPTDAAPRRRGSAGVLLGGAALLAAVGAGAWIALADPFAERAAAAPPAPAAGNLLGDTWSFETVDGRGPEAAWTVPDESPAGWTWVPEAATSGGLGARTTPDADGWARLLSVERFRAPGPDEALRFSAVSGAPGVSLLVRWLAEGQPPLDTVVASGRGAISGTARPPPGALEYRVGVSSLGPGDVDDLDLRVVAAAEAATGDPARDGAALTRGLFGVRVGDPRGLTVFRGAERVLHLAPAVLVGTDGADLPPTVARLPGDGVVAGPGGLRASVDGGVREEGRRLVVSERLAGVPAGVAVRHHGVVSGSLARSPLGVRSSRGFERFESGFRVEGVDALLLGSTQDRLVVELGAPFTLAAAHRDDGTIALTLELPGGGDVAVDLALQAEFQEERLAAAGLRDELLRHEAEGRLGAALAAVGVIVSEYPFDERVFEEAVAARGRLQAVMQERLDALDHDLEDALFLGSASRCREVRAAALAEAARFAGSDAEDLFRARADAVEERAARLLAEDVERRRSRVAALAESFAAHGDYPLLAEEYRRFLEEHLEGDAAGDVAEAPGADAEDAR